jgi:predicted dehydrogenase
MTSPRTLVLVGTGAYALRDVHGPGVVLRSLAQWAADNGGASAWEIAILHRSESGRARAEAEGKRVRSEIPGTPSLSFFAASSDESEAVLESAHALFVCVPDSAHEQYALRGIDAGVPTWIVKPLTGDGERSAALASRAESKSTPVWVDYHKRFDVSNRLLRSTLDTGDHGAPLLFSVRYSQPRDLPLQGFAWTGETNVFSYIGCHYVDQLFYLMPGLEIESVEAHGIAGPVFERFGHSAWDTILARFDCRWRGRPLSAQFEIGWNNPLASPTKSLQVVELACERGRHFMDQTRRGVEIWSDDGVVTPNPYFFARLHDPTTGAPRYQGYGWESVREFLDFTLRSAADRALALANDSLPWAREAARVDAVLDRVGRSLARSARIDG